MEEYLENLGYKIGNFLRLIILTYLIFCVFMWFYYFTNLHEVPNDCSFFSFSAHIGFMVLLVIFMLLIICT